jgi:peptide/nickel transport system substrate-binding protein
VSKRGWSALALVALAAVVAACGKSAPGTTSSSGGSSAAAGGSTSGPSTTAALPVTTPAAKGPVDKVTWAVYRETNSLDPIYAFDYPENTVIFAICDALFRQQADGSVVPGLASAAATPDPLTLVLTIRSGVTFWDGQPLTADDVVYSLKRQMDTKLAGYYGQVFNRVASIDATGPLEVTIKLKQPDYFLQGELSSLAGIVLEKKFTEQQGDKYGKPSGGTMCTGAFKLKSWKVGDVLAVEKNDSYWDPNLKPQVGEIDFKGVPDEAALTAGLQTGEIDGTYALQLSTLDQLRSSSAVNVILGPSFIADAFIVSSFKGPLGDARVRTALSMAMDRPSYINATWKGAAAIPHALANPGTFGYAKDVFQAGYDALPPLTQDLAAAKQLVQQAGATGKTIVIGESSELASVQTAANALAAAAQSIGMKATLHSVSAANYINFFIDPKARAAVDGFFTQNYSDYADGETSLYTTLTMPGGSQNYPPYNNQQVIDLYNKARGEADPNARAQDEVDAQKVITQDMVWIPLSVPDTILILNKKLTGAPSSFQYMFGPWAASLGAAG